MFITSWADSSHNSFWNPVNRCWEIQLKKWFISLCIKVHILKGHYSAKNYLTRTSWCHALVKLPLKFFWNQKKSCWKIEQSIIITYVLNWKGHNSAKNHLTKTSWLHAQLLLVLKLPMKFYWNPGSNCWEIEPTRIVLYIHKFKLQRAKTLEIIIRPGPAGSMHISLW